MKNESKHTPGPWEVNATSYACIIFNKMNGAIANIPHEGKHKKEHEANANLIAAAPDMLEALRKIRTLTDLVYTDDERLKEVFKIANDQAEKIDPFKL